MPLQRRLPKHGFKNPFRTEYASLNLDRLLEAFEGKQEISLDDIYERGLCKRGAAVKILGRGEVAAAVTVEAHRFSASAAEKIQNAGGQAKALEG
jgi:large subunit ribosomal protein L15